MSPHRLVLVIALLAATIQTRPALAELDDEAIVQHSLELVLAPPPLGQQALAALVQEGDPRLVHTLITAMRYAPALNAAMNDGLRRLTGVAEADNWFDWMLWREGTSEPSAHPTFATFQRRLFARIDPAFVDFLPAGVAHDIRLEEITWGGVPVDGIPALTNPDFISPADASYPGADDLVFGVEINGDARAYPLRILNWHEMFNDVVGGVPVSLAYCTLCGAGILFDTSVTGHREPFIFGSSGFLYRSNKLMYDTATRSLWNQFTGRPVVGPLTGSGIELEIRPVTITTWQRWRTENPHTIVLTPETGYTRDYSPGAAYGAYFASEELMFPALLRDPTLAAKDFVFGIRAPGGAKAWPLEVFAGGAVINDRVGLNEVVLVGDAESRTVRAYRSDGIVFTAADDDHPGRLVGEGQSWQVTEAALRAEDGRTLPRQAGHVAYWFAWAGYLRDADLYAP